jgi:hypothetical protein
MKESSSFSRPYYETKAEFYKELDVNGREIELFTKKFIYLF